VAGLKLELFASAFLTLAVMLLALGVYFIRGERTVAAIALVEWGVMERLGLFGPFYFTGPRSQPSATLPSPRLVVSGALHR
jgi:hypothetical protein